MDGMLGGEHEVVDPAGAHGVSDGAGLFVDPAAESPGLGGEAGVVLHPVRGVVGIEPVSFGAPFGEGDGSGAVLVFAGALDDEFELPQVDGFFGVEFAIGFYFFVGLS